MELFRHFLICALVEHFRRYAHEIKFVIGLHDTQKFHPIVKYEHYQISSGARPNLMRPYTEYRIDVIASIAFLGSCPKSALNLYICLPLNSLTLINAELLMSFPPLFYVNSVFCMCLVCFCLLLISIKTSYQKNNLG